MTPDPNNERPTPEPADDTPFTYGDGTMMLLRSQAFDVQEDFGTVVSGPAHLPSPGMDIPLPIAAPEEDPLVRMERKLDTALRQIEKLQQRLESIDLALARAVAR